MRDAPSIIIIRKLLEKGAKVKTYDPIAIENAKKIFAHDKNIQFTSDAYEAAKNADLLIVVTEWNEFRQLDLEKVKKLMRQYIIIDGRNIYEPQKVKELGFTYQGVGR